MVNQSFSFNLNFVTALVVSSALLTACQGQNPFRRESNPVKDYPHSMESGNQPYVPGQKQTPPPKANGPEDGKVVVDKVPCFEPIKIEIDPDHGKSLMKFSEEIETSYNLKITVNGPQAATSEPKLVGPENSISKLAARQDNVLTYIFTWKPAKGQAAQAPAETLVVGFDGKPAVGACENAKNRVSFSLVVSKASNVPSVSFSEVKNKIKFGDDFYFKVIVDDLTASKDKTPKIDFEGSAGLLNCEPSQALSETKYVFICHFDSNLIKGVEEKKLANSGKEGSVTFSITAVSHAGVPSAATPQKIKVLFEVQPKSTQTKSTPLPPTRPAELTAQGAKQ